MTADEIIEEAMARSRMDADDSIYAGACPGGHCSSLSFSFIGKQIIRNVYFTRFGFFPASVVVVVIVVVVVVGDGLFQRLARFLV